MICYQMRYDRTMMYIRLNNYLTIYRLNRVEKIDMI